jgi:hypothetical protein
VLRGYANCNSGAGHRLCWAMSSTRWSAELSRVYGTATRREPDLWGIGAWGLRTKSARAMVQVEERPQT